MSDTNSLARLLETLDNVFGVTGNEEEVAGALKNEMAGFFDDYYADPLGNQYYIRKGTASDKRVMFAAHMDEIGFIIKYIDDDGFARIFPVGYHDDKMVVNQDLVFNTASGKKVYGVTGAKPFHMMSEDELHSPLKIQDLFVDFGVQSAAEARALGLEIGDLGGYSRRGFFLNGTDYYSGKAVDDRSGLAVLVEVMRRLKDEPLLPTICMAGTTQEEIGMHGGGPAARSFKPELFFAVDVTLTGGSPGIEWRDSSQKMGGGICVKYYDWDPNVSCGNTVPRHLTNRMIELAKKHHIPFQREVMMGGGTDAWPASLADSGVLAGGISIPSRYIHTAVGTVKLSDLEHCVNYIIAYLKDYQSL
ncbi:M42 family metallopeptidase [Treponema primitia]|uniref:M42 family metallopeptidase n=1 Tax=Treponema primitia TaxID=88058 RepID=UPI0002554C9C|nr:M20/M25/M40 family metallo-hydrolase [Treponema primitia]